MRKFEIIEANSKEKLQKKIEEFLDDQFKSLVNVSVGVSFQGTLFPNLYVATVVYDI
ncbi:hypothetical protein RJG79_00670 [Mycoplasmatota bacterium WC44]